MFLGLDFMKWYSKGSGVCLAPCQAGAGNGWCVVVHQLSGGGGVLQDVFLGVPASEGGQMRHGCLDLPSCRDSQLAVAQLYSGLYGSGCVVAGLPV